MIDEVVRSIAAAIRAVVPPEYEIYTENVHQGAKLPCFFVECKDAQRVDMLNNQFFIRAELAVICENDSDTKKQETDSITAVLFHALRVVYAGKQQLNGRRISGKWQDGRFVINATYDIWPNIGSTDTDMMLELEKREYGNG
ncbi:MAG: hypothetical protein IJ297_07230 [Clostridia bacterium]|nr:hypothetical protein [Clostridia bacterium]